MNERKVRETCTNCRMKCKGKNIRSSEVTNSPTILKSRDKYSTKHTVFCSFLEETSVNRKKEQTGTRTGKRKHNLKYSFTLEENIYQTCRKLFLPTMDISQTFVRCALQKRQTSGVIKCDKRGSSDLLLKLRMKYRIGLVSISGPIQVKNNSRRRTAKKYLGSHLNISTIFMMYKEACDLQNIPPDYVIY